MRHTHILNIDLWFYCLKSFPWGDKRIHSMGCMNRVHLYLGIQLFFKWTKLRTWSITGLSLSPWVGVPGGCYEGTLGHFHVDLTFLSMEPDTHPNKRVEDWPCLHCLGGVGEWWGVRVGGRRESCGTKGKYLPLLCPKASYLQDPNEPFFPASSLSCLKVSFLHICLKNYFRKSMIFCHLEFFLNWQFVLQKFYNPAIGNLENGEK